MVRLLSLVICVLLATSVVLLRGQSVADQTVTTISEVLALDGREAEANPRPVKLKGVVLGDSTMFPFISLYDEGRAVGVKLKRDRPPLKPGDVVEIEGRTTMTNVGGYMHPRVVAESIKVIGTSELPPARPITAEELVSTANYDQWVSLEGHVAQWKYHAPDLQVRIVMREGYADANVTVRDAAEVPARLSGAFIRLSGAVVSTPALGKVLFVPELKQMEVIEPGYENVFDAPLASVSDVMSRKLDYGRRWRVKGVVAARVQERTIVITGPDGGMTCHLFAARGPEQADTIYGDGGPWPEINPGDEVEIVGSIIAVGDAETRSCGLTWCQIRVTGKTNPPKPKPVDIDTLLTWKNQDDWVSVDVVVIGWMLQNNTLCYAVLGSHHYSQIYVREFGTMPFPSDLHGARVRFTGVSRSLLRSSTDALLVPDPSLVQVVKPGSDDPFAVPSVSAAEISAGRLPPSDRVKMRGILIGRTSDTIIYVRGQDGALCANLQIRWNRPSNTRGMLFADCGEWPALHVGDEVEIMGSPLRSPEGSRVNGFDLYASHVRVIGHAGEAKPVGTTLEELAEGANSSDLVEVRGRMLALHQVPMDRGEWRTTMLLESGGVRMPATHQGQGRASFDTIKVDDEVLLRGLVDHATDRDPRQLWLTSASDVRSLGMSPAVRARRIWLWGGGGVLILGVLLAWIAILRRAGRMQAEAAAMLEQRVNERTVELRRTQADLTRSLAQERELGELKSRFVTMVSHEFRTPLGIIMSAIELIRHYDERLPGEQRKELHQDIFSSTRHMAGLMEQVLVLGRVEAGKLACKTAPCDLNALAEKLTDECLSSTNRKCPVVWRADGDLSGAQADEALLRHIFGNLISNAVKYSPEGSPVEFTARRDGGSAVFRVIDHGIGIPAADRQHLFQAFQRGSNVGETPGTGLGLVIVKRCVDLHGGSVEIESESGKGTTFTVRLPLFDQ